MRKKMKRFPASKESRIQLGKFHCHPNSRTVGCVSGIYHFFAGKNNSSSSSSSCKRLPSSAFRRKEDESPSTKPSLQAQKRETPSSQRRKVGRSTETRKDTSHVTAVAQTTSVFLRNLHLRRQYSCEGALRSPALPCDIRRPTSPEAPDSPRRPTTLVERLMGLGEFPASSPETAAGRQRRLLGAAEGCEGRLVSLKRIIDAARAAENRKRADEAVEGIKVDIGCRERSDDGDDSSVEAVKRTDAGNGEQPSPDSVLDVMISPTKFSSNRSKQGITGEARAMAELRTSQPSNDVGDICSAGKWHKDPRRTAEESHNPVARQIATEGRLPRMLKRSHELKPPLEEFGRGRGELITEGGRPRPWRWTRSQAMVETVREVLERSRWEQRMEAGKVAVALERGIFGDLVDELGRDFCTLLRDIGNDILPA